MLRIKQSTNASYYTNEHGEKENYYDKESKGFWIGSAKEPLKLGDNLKIEEYNKLFKGQGIEGKQLTYVTGKNRTYDLTLSCNKDLSILKAAYPEFATTFDEITFKAVNDTLALAQQFIAVRQTKNGVTTKNFDTSSVFGVFHHSTSRELDPQEHYHCLLMPVSFNENGKAFANDVKKLFKNQKLLGAVFQKSIAQGIEQKLGLKTKFNEKGLTSINGISQEERKHFSKRQAQIEKLAGPGATYEQKDKASLASREKKTDYDLDKLKENWNKELKEKFGFNAERFQKMQQMKTTDLSVNKTVDNTKIQPSFFKQISKMTGIKATKTSKAKTPLSNNKKSGAQKAISIQSSSDTKTALLNSITNAQTSLNSLQSQIASMSSDDPNKLQALSNFISLGFQLTALQAKLAVFEAKEFEKKLKEFQEEDKKEKKEDGLNNNKTKSNEKSKTQSRAPARTK